MNYVREYWERISSGEIVTSRRVKAVYGRLVAEMDAADESSPYYFDEAVGERPIIFVERFCKQSQGTLGESLTLELFQKAYIQLLFGWLERATGYRRFRETLFLVGRKNGKSTLLAALALYMLVADYEGAAEIYSVATKKDQAKKTLTEAVNMVKQSPELSAILKKRRNDIYFPATASKFEALASDSNTLDGLNSHAVIIDELHAIRDRNLYEVMKQSTSSRRQPLVIMITTSGTVRESVFDNLYGYACEVADGQTPDERFLPVLYELDKREEWTDPTAWIKANPGLGTIKQYTTLADFVERAKKNPEDLPGVLCKDFNVKATGAASWLSYEDAVNEATFKPEEVYNTYANLRTRIVRVEKSDAEGDPGNVTVTIANKTQDIAGSISDLQSRALIGETYAQGATNQQIYNFSDNADATHPAKLQLYISDSVVRINKMLLNVEFEAFRAYEKAIGGGGGQTTSSGGGQTTSSGGGQTTSSGGGSTTSSGGGQTSGGTALESSNVLPSETNGQAVHNHGISQHARLATTSDGKTVDGYETFIWSGAHTHPSHTHRISAHTHEVYDHTHRVSAHTHTVKDHTHTVKDHTHAIEFGIYEGQRASKATIKVDGKEIPAPSSYSNIDIVEYLATDSNGKIRRNSWHSIEILPDNMSRIVGAVFAQTFCNSRGGGDY